MKKDLFLISLVSFVFFIFGNWILSLTSLDEGRNFYATLHMLRTGDFIVPYYNCNYRFEKPPMLYWLGSLSFLIFGISEFSARLISGLSAFGTTLLIYFITLKHVSREKALLSALTFPLFIHTWIESRAYVPEFTLVFFSTLGVYLFSIDRFTLGWTALALAFLTKGPVGVILPIGIYLLWRRDLKFLNFKGVLLFILIGFSWYFLMIYKFGFNFFFKFFIFENIYRFTGTYQIHNMPIYFYPLVILVSSILFLPVFLKILKDFDKRLLPFAGWFLLVLVFYSLSKNKLHHYILFSYPALSVIIGFYLTKRYIKYAYIVGSFLLLILMFGVYIYEQKRFTPKAVDFLKNSEPQKLYFYKHENSAIVAYLYRCITKENKFKKGDYVITKKKYLRDFKNYKLLIEGLEFEGKEVLIKVE
ncbi:ArnT family glycosyltransferase [Aquifex aeolicus]|uniref:Uncharacterized protein aq_1704 n=1 Tax=Aquifex aeolicus (strain VF5) TaxID=224324 RepID=Y1704_AQUAE|nr:glycosyltransferase family 39 protein [Aquifex aeolicus]O67601.1 RecName: Full=Uncharacterized protein aq_1704 [Aquifex aeolicus VF5]AAC07577.1 hypothetical protein aq_1695a [Aquifex aeolicus VF5]